MSIVYERVALLIETFSRSLQSITFVSLIIRLQSIIIGLELDLRNIWDYQVISSRWMLVFIFGRKKGL